MNIIGMNIDLRLLYHDDDFILIILLGDLRDMIIDD